MNEITERIFEAHVRKQIAQKILPHRSDLILMNSKKAVDIMICRNGETPALYLIEVKFHKSKHGRLGFGSSKGIGFQPEILLKMPDYFSRYMKWVIGEESRGIHEFAVLDNYEMQQFVSGGKVGEKHNNIQKLIFTQVDWLTEQQLVTRLLEWLQ